MVAVAYIGTKGAGLLPLQPRDRLVVDMSLAAVKTGATNPHEIKKFQDSGVEVFTRDHLHAKFVISRKTLIASSANVSSNSQNTLDEAGIITTDPVAIARATDFFEQLCTTPVRNEYLKKCIEEYRPPQPNGSSNKKGHKKPGRVRQAKLWFVGGLRLFELPEEDKQRMEKIENKAEEKLKRPGKTSVSWVRYARRPKFMDQIRDGDWVVECINDGGHRRVGAPAQVLGQDKLKSSKGRQFDLLMLETPDAGEAFTISAFRRRVKRFEPALDKGSPRTRAIENDDHADRILRLWTASGRISKKKPRSTSRTRK
jgi:hypothetical protein